MSQTIEDAFTDWLNEEGASLIKDNVDLAGVVGEFVGENFADLLKEEGTTVEKVLEGVIEEMDFSDEAGNILSTAYENGDLQSVIHDAIKRSVERLVGVAQWDKFTGDTKDRLDGHSDCMVEMRDTINNLENRLDIEALANSKLQSEVRSLWRVLDGLKNHRPWWRFW